jgi:hypothetical protein
MAKRRSSYTPNKRRSRELIGSIDAAVYEAAQMLKESVLDHWQMLPGYPGYTTGNFETGEAVKIQIDAIRTVRGKRSTSVYSPASRLDNDGEEHPYPVYWELGHLNMWTVKWEEQPIFRPALEAAFPEIRNAVARIIGGSPFGDGTPTQRTGAISVREE